MLSSAKKLLSGRLMWAAGVAVAMFIGVSQLRADGGGQSFTTLHPDFTQELFGASGNLSDPDFGILGGVAFAPDGDVWSSECVFDGTRLHRFDKNNVVVPEQHGTPLHPEMVVQTQGGCGLTNHPDGALYSNSSAGIWKLDAETGLPLGEGPQGPGGNALGIAVDPQAGHHIVYVGSDCHPSLNISSTTCTIWDLNPATNTAGVFARLSRTELEFLDGIYFDPSGQYLFGAHRDVGETTAHNSLRIIRRPQTLGDPGTAPVDDTQIVQDVAMTSEPDGVAFHATDGFVVTLNESDDGPGVGGTMTRFDFGGNFEAAPSQSVFASGGFRGDLLQVGADSCVYATQGALFGSGGTSGVRYNDLTETSENSIVKICGGFAPPPGMNTPGSISGFAYVDANRNTVKDEGELVLAGVAITLTGSGTVVTDGNGSYTFATLQAGSYSVSAAAIASGKALFTSSPLGVELAAGEDRADVNFGYVPGSISGFAYVDTNRSGGKDVGEPGIGGVVIALAGGGTTTTTGDGSYSFTDLDAATHSVSAPATASGKALFTASPLSVVLAAGEDRSNVNFGYVPGGLSGFAYVDSNRNSVKDSGEPGIGGVLISLAGGGTATTAGDGSYSVTNLDAATYNVSAPATASGKALFTASPLSVVLAAGEDRSNVNFGYVGATITGSVYTDTNNNGVRDTGEPGVIGVTVTLTGTSSGTTVTDTNGTFTFTNLPQGTYYVTVPPPGTGFAVVTTVTVTAGQTPGIINVGYPPASAPPNNWSGISGKRISGTLIGGGGLQITLGASNQVFCFGSGGTSMPVTVNANCGQTSLTTVRGTASSAAPSPTSGTYTITESFNNPAFTLGSAQTGGGATTFAVNQGATVLTFTYSNGSTIFLSGTLQLLTLTQTASSNGNVITTLQASFNFSSGTSQFASQFGAGGSGLLRFDLGGGEELLNLYHGTVSSAAAFVTYTQGGWGAPPSGNNPGMLLKNNFATVYPNGVTIGGSPYYLKFTSASAIENFLPAGGKAAALKVSATNPTSSAAGVLAGQVLAVRLGVDFSNAGVITGGLASQRIASGPLVGYTVAQALALANQALAGNTSALPSGVTITTLNDQMTSINETYDNGTTNRGFLVP